MTEKLTLAQKLHRRHIKRPPAVIYPVLARIWQLMYQKRLGLTFEYKIDPKKIKGPFIVVSNHASRLDYIFTGIPFLPHRMNFVAGYNEFFRSHLAMVFRLLQVIPKKNFVPDIYCVREIRRILKSGGSICIFPEGMSSISGANQPVSLGSAKLLKSSGVPVYATHISGGYLTSTKYCLDERRGKVHVVVDQLFTVEELEALTVEEIQDKLHAHLCQDDYAWNKKTRAAYDGHGQMAKNMHDLLYICPKCGKEFTMHGEGNTIVCKECGNGATVNEYYDLIPLDDSCIIPETPRLWFDMERKRAAESVKDPDFVLTEKVQLGMIPPYEYLKNQATSEIVGEGILTLDKTGITYRGSRRGEEVELHMPIAQLPTYGMCTDVSRFYTFIDGEFCEFFPEGRTVGKWLHCTEEMHRHMGGKWQNFKDADTRYDKLRF
ncbi:MAG: 1-acyl-sn-glycerol-3-phosphate acyltransferase [Firmicutes bacterium]|nr:1-acyl-sn-glycerol-3-phosphate acyltransferase [Bacillota bacterium]